MNRAPLERAVQKLAEQLGYPFHEAPEACMARQIASLPAAWLLPPDLHAIEGTRHGRASYDLTLHLIDRGAALPHPERARRWAEMERDALDLFSRLTETPCVVAVENLTLRPRSAALTNHGEIALTASCRVLTCF